VFGYLLKHAHLALEHRAQAALADVGVTVRDLGVLRDRRAQALGNKIRRRNVIALTDHGWEVFRQAESRYSETERDFTATLGDAGAAGPEQAPGHVFIKKRQVTHR
jgi:hypothetical protein